MKQLIKKEFLLGWKWYNYIFFLFPVLLLIPNYPAFTGMIYIFFFVTTLFPTFLTNNDFKFMTGLPIKRNDIVAVRLFDVLFGQLGTILVAIPFMCIKVFAMKMGPSPLMDPNFAFIGMMMTAYALFDVVFFSTYFKELKLPISMLLSILSFMAFTALLETLVQVIPPFRAVLDTFDLRYIGWRLMVLFVGIAIYVGGIILSFRLACKRFSRYNM